MKIGILTYHRAHNYGAVFQAYALMKYLQKLDLEVEFLDYWPLYRQGMYDMIDTSFFKERTGTKRKIKRIGKLLLIFPEKAIRYAKFQKFIKRNFSICKSFSPLKGGNIPSSFDIVVYGSDQIWRYNKFPKFVGYDPVYWGEFPTNKRMKKVAYAASMGFARIIEGHEEILAKYLKNFDLISVREQQMCSLLQPMTEKTIYHVLDPVFLLDQLDWDLMVSRKLHVPDKYLLLYNLSNSLKAIELANKISKLHGYRVIEITGEIRPFRNPFKTRQSAGPMDFISLISKASFVISTSFHGVAFSLVYKKQFFALGMNDNADRVHSLLDCLQIPERYLEHTHEFTNCPDINYSKVYELLHREKGKSKRFLGDVLEVTKSCR